MRTTDGTLMKLPFSPRSKYWRMSPRQIGSAAAQGESGAREFLERYKRRRRTWWRQLSRAWSRLPERLGVTRDWQMVLDPSASDTARQRAARRIARAMVADQKADTHTVAPLTEAVLRAGRELLRAQKHIRVYVEGRLEKHQDVTPEAVVPLVALREYMDALSRAKAREIARHFEKAFGPRERRGRLPDDPKALAEEIRSAAAQVREHGHKVTQERVAEELSIGVRTLQYRVKRTGMGWADLSGA